jgi:AcrR family transcriptional regulator
MTTEAPLSRLPRGRHGLSRDEVETSQRLRMFVAMADAMVEKGYAGTSVTDVITRAGVSRETFYQRFSSKADCFMGAFDAAAELLLGTVGAAVERPASASDGAGDSGGAGGSGHRRPLDAAARLAGFDLALTTYLDTLADHPAYARLFLVEVYAAGPDAIRRRAELQQRIVDTVAALLGTTSAAGRFACEVLVAAVSAMVTVPLVADDPAALRALQAPIVDLVRRALEADADARA